MDSTTKTKIAETYRTIKEVADATSLDLTLRQLLLMLDVAQARDDGISQQALSDRHDLGKSTTSKIVAALSGTAGEVKRQGMGLLEVNLDPNDLRSRIVSLSKKGETVLTRAVREGKR